MRSIVRSIVISIVRSILGTQRESDGREEDARRLDPAASATVVNDGPFETTHDDEHGRPRSRGREHPSSEPEGGCSREKQVATRFSPLP